MGAIEEALTRAGLTSERLPSGTSDRGVLFYQAPGIRALDIWRMLRAEVHATGHWPLLLGAANSLASHRATMADPGSDSPEVLIAKAEEIDVDAFFRSRIAEQEEHGELPRGDWPEDVSPSHDILIHQETLSRKPLAKVIVALLPVPTPWHAFAYLVFGGWNECPSPEEQAAVHRYWHERYGTELVGISQDTIECHVPRPPTRQADALALARQHYAYCSDIVDQGTETIDALAGGLLGGSAWFFWWD